VRQPSVICSIAAAFLVAAPAALAGPTVETDSTVSGTQIHQELNFGADAIHYWFKAENAAGMPEFCVTLKLQRKKGKSWRGIGRGSRKGLTDCCDHGNTDCFPRETLGVWDLFLYPRGKLERKVRRGRLRIHASTDLGPSLVLRLGHQGS
jgi:hypothetical protein